MVLPAQNKISDETIYGMLRKNDPFVWEILYDKYSSPIYGLICNLTDDKKTAEAIFTDLFRGLPKENILSDIKYALCPVLLRYTYSYTIRRLHQYGLPAKSLHSPEDAKLIQLLLTQCNSPEAAAIILNITKEQAKEKLHNEFLKLHNQNNSVINPASNDGYSADNLLWPG